MSSVLLQHNNFFVYSLQLDLVHYIFRKIFTILNVITVEIHNYFISIQVHFIKVIDLTSCVVFECIMFCLSIKLFDLLHHRFWM